VGRSEFASQGQIRFSEPKGHREYFIQIVEEERGMESVDKETLRNWLEQPDLFLMDVRSTFAWDHSIAKIKQAHRFAPDKLPRMLQDIPKNRKLVIYCEDGKTTCPWMAQKLERMGFVNLYVLEGGFQVWKGKEYLQVPKEVDFTAVPATR
jgi:rhodanese-related sulfurtransferase